MPTWKLNYAKKWRRGASAGETLVANWRSASGATEPLAPTSIVLDWNGIIYISEWSKNRVIRWIPDTALGECIAGCIQTSGLMANQLSGPIGLGFDSNGSLYVSDNGNHRVQKFEMVTGCGECLIGLLIAWFDFSQIEHRVYKT